MSGNRRRDEAEVAGRGEDAGTAGRRHRPLLVAWLTAVLWAGTGPEVSAQGDGGPPTRRAGPTQHTAAASHRIPPRVRRASRIDLSRTALPSDDWTFRPTVVVRRGTSQGSGTIIASVDGETLVLTAAHVVAETGPISIELHRYNLGLERTAPAPGTWPRPIAAALAASDPAADLAILRIENLGALPYVARLAPPRREPAVDSIVTSIGIDLGTRLSSWSSRLVEILWFELNDTRDERLFFMTARTPEHGRSGGGLFLPDGDLVGVCVGHAELVRGRRMGVFASRESIRQLLTDFDLAAAVARSELRQSRLGGRPAGRPGIAADPGRTARTEAAADPAVTRTRAVEGPR